MRQFSAATLTGIVAEMSTLRCRWLEWSEYNDPLPISWLPFPNSDRQLRGALVPPPQPESARYRGTAARALRGGDIRIGAQLV